MLAFVILATLAFLAQALFMWRASNTIGEIRKEVREVRADVKQRMDPLAQSLTEILSNSREPARTIMGNLADISRIARDRTIRMDQLAEDLADRTRLQVVRVDQLVTSLVDKVETTTDRVQQTVLLPVQEISALAKALKAGLGFLFSRRRGSGVSETTQDEQLFI
jgi:transcriptional accessory protein Tex/SPT6